MKMFALRVLAILLLVMGSATVFAGTNTDLGTQTGETTGQMGVQLASTLYCDTKDLIQGDVGLMLGLVIVFMAIWSLVRGGKIVPAVVTMIFGVLITALPSLIESSFSGLNSLLTESQMSKAKYVPPYCDSGGDMTSVSTGKKEDDLYVPGLTY